jgi:tetratricopeptide (TPR) repeat protein
MNTYIKAGIPENIPIYRHINKLIDNINKLMCPKDYCFIKNNYPWNWIDEIVNDINEYDIFTRWQMAIHPDGREVSIYINLESYEKAIEHFKEILAILSPIFKAIKKSEEDSNRCLHSYTLINETRQHIVSTGWDKFLKDSCLYASPTDSSSVDSDALPALEGVSNIEIDDEGEVKILESTRVEDEDSEEEEDEDSEEEEEEDSEEEEEEEEEEEVSDKLPEVVEPSKAEVKGEKPSLEELFKCGKIKITFNDVIDNIHHIDYVCNGESDESITGLNIQFIIPIIKSDVIKNLFRREIKDDKFE